MDVCVCVCLWGYSCYQCIPLKIAVQFLCSVWDVCTFTAGAQHRHVCVCACARCVHMNLYFKDKSNNIIYAYGKASYSLSLSYLKHHWFNVDHFWCIAHTINCFLLLLLFVFPKKGCPATMPAIGASVVSFSSLTILLSKISIIRANNGRVRFTSAREMLHFFHFGAAPLYPKMLYTFSFSMFSLTYNANWNQFIFVQHHRHLSAQMRNSSITIAIHSFWHWFQKFN